MPIYNSLVRPSLLVICLVLTSVASAQWSDKKLIGPGGESTVATDGKGNVYVTVHQPCKLYASHDSGASFTDQNIDFDQAFCDMDVYAWPNGDVNVSYIRSSSGNDITGMASYFSTNNGTSFTKGSAVNGKLDREWLAPNLVNGELYMDYSNGYIRGPIRWGCSWPPRRTTARLFSSEAGLTMSLLPTTPSIPISRHPRMGESMLCGPPPRTMTRSTGSIIPTRPMAAGPLRATKRSARFIKIGETRKSDGFSDA